VQIFAEFPKERAPNDSEVHKNDNFQAYSYLFSGKFQASSPTLPVLYRTVSRSIRFVQIVAKFPGERAPNDSGVLKKEIFGHSVTYFVGNFRHQV